MLMMDSCFLIDLMTGEEQATNLLDSIGEDEVCSNSLVFWELWKGVCTHSKEGIQDSVLNILNRFDWEDLAVPTMFKAGEIHSILVADGRPLSDADLLIAASAMLHCDGLISNDKAFQTVAGLEVHTY